MKQPITYPNITVHPLKNRMRMFFKSVLLLMIGSGIISCNEADVSSSYRMKEMQEITNYQLGHWVYKSIYYYKDNRHSLSVGMSGTTKFQSESSRSEYQHNSDSIVITNKYPSDSIEGVWTSYEQTIFHIKNNKISDRYTIRPDHPSLHYHIEKYSYEDDLLTVYQTDNYTYNFIYENNLLMKLIVYPSDGNKEDPSEAWTYQYENGKIKSILKYYKLNEKLTDFPVIRRNFSYTNDRLTRVTSSYFNNNSNEWSDEHGAVNYTYDKKGLLTKINITSEQTEINYIYEKGKCEDIRIPVLNRLTLEDIR